MNQESLNRQILGKLNEDIQLRASRVSDALLNGAFRSIFLVPKALEYSEPDIFQLDQSPDQIMWRRLDSYQLRFLELALLNDEIPTARYQVEKEYDFIVVMDVSQSMMLDWWQLYGGAVDSRARHQANGSTLTGIRTKLFVAKYALAAFAQAAVNRKFRIVIIFAGAGGVRIFQPPQSKGIEWFLLAQIDDHYRAVATKASAEPPRLVEALSMVLRHSHRCVVLCISDFADTRQHVYENAPRTRMSSLIEPLAEIAARHRLLVFQVNDEREIQPEMTDFALMDTKNCPYLNGEATSQNSARNVDIRQLAAFRQHGRQWYQSLEEAFLTSGIRFGRVLVGIDDLDVEKRVCELGLVAD